MNTKKPFEKVVAEHGPTVLRVCRAVLGEHDADDAWSETFLAAMRAYPELPADANVQAWLVTIAHRKAIDVTRLRRRAAVPVGEVPERASTLGVPGALDHELQDALGGLPDKQRRAVALHYLGGLAYAEVAELLGGTADASRRAAADGMRALRLAYAIPERTGAGK
ncbi:RNA polymerase sigma factor [Subtercola sp. RTI3]|uniref:RNA polymerase sigma factor n=1 Tax=Subtercola sp. RTI3 TaxID=3048639 RepID=UPI002B238039|nr:RNA polymerase sigma factor [Subtercola sp. RTI3]MEA9986227.1 RNA polymerase sigma factor [Subtercola sp. RTI3]